MLHNTSRGPASSVDFAFEDVPEHAFFRVARKDGLLGTIPAETGGAAPTALSDASADVVECVVTWRDARDKVRETRATVRT
ncbi:hypothetical protein GCM10011359_02810 [Nesterenkonia alkaliphila]|nr:hypothetical protein GCM10011359_02810 [Nesterenkonia alkaliphila]